jgi:hypothetical protein
VASPFQLPDLEALMKKENQKILTPLVSLDTPGKATVEVVILADPVSGLRSSQFKLIIKYFPIT